MKTLIRLLVILTMLALAACGGGGNSGNATPPDGGGPPTLPAATAPTITTQPAAQSVTTPAPAAFSVVAGGTAPLSYQWRSSSDGTNWTDIAGANGSGFDTGATHIGMEGRYYAVVVSNSAGSVTSAAARLTVLAAPVGPSGEFPHAAIPLAVAVTPADGALATFDVASSAQATVRVPDGASGLAADNGVTLTIGVPGNAFLENQSLAVTRVTLAGLDSGHPLPFQSVIGAVHLGPSDASLPELQASNLVRITFTLAPEALDALGGQPVIFSARGDGTQLHLVPVFKNDDGAWSAVTLTTAVDHLGIFGLAVTSTEQAAALAAAWPSYGDFQLEAALAPASYGLRKAAIAARPAAQALHLRRPATESSGQDDWAAQMQARIDAYYSDQVVPALNAANAANADIAQFSDAAQKVLAWERMRQLAGLADEGSDVLTQLIDLETRGLEKAMADCSARGNAASAVQALGLLRQITLLGGTPDVTADSVLGACGRSSFDVSVTFSQVHSASYTRIFNGSPENAYTEPLQSSTTTTGQLHLTDTIPELSSVTLDQSLVDDLKCATGAYLCNSRKVTITAHETAPGISLCGGRFYGSYSVARWNLDARGRNAAPLLAVNFVNSFGCSEASFLVSANGTTETNQDANGNVTTKTTTASDWVDTVSWNGTAALGTSSRIVRRSKPVIAEYIEDGGTERWTTTLGFKITERLPGN